MRTAAAVIPALLLVLAPSGAPAADPECAPLLERIASGRPAVGEPLRRPAELAAFYAGRGCRPAWLRDGVAGPAARQLLSAVSAADRDGLRPGDYHPAPIGRLLDLSVPSIELDLLLSDAFLQLAAHLAGGAVDPTALSAEWNIPRRELDLVVLLRDALAAGRVGEALAGLTPDTSAYRALRDALGRLREAAAGGGWPTVPEGPALRRGDRGPRVAALRARLAATDEVPAGDDFDEALAAALRRFQRAHGLEADAIAGARTLAALNAPASWRVVQVAANLERLRWLPADPGPRRVVVNIADFSLEAFDDGAPVLAMRVIAGRAARRTPFFSGEITSIVFNPTWTIPLKIALEDELPRILENRDWLLENDVRVFRWEDGRWRPAAKGEVQWITLGPGRFPYRLVQQPGPRNALGRIKFEIPNPHDVYLHDTPARELFDRANRSFSSGCVRLERPLDLAELLLRPDPAWSRKGLEAAVAAGDTRRVPLSRPMPVYLLYQTAWVDGEGVLQLREDIYERDLPLARALGLAVPAP